MQVRTGKSTVTVCLCALFAAASTHAALVVTFDNQGTGNANGTTLIAQNVEDGLDGETVNGTQVPDQSDITTLDYAIPIANGTHTEYGWVAYYNSTGTTLEDLLHFDNSINVSGTTYQSMFVYSGTTLTQLENNTSLFDAILGYKYLASIDQNLDNSFPTYDPTGDQGGVILSTGGTPISTPYEYDLQPPSGLGGPVVPEPSTVFAGLFLLVPFGVGVVRLLRKKSVYESVCSSK